MQEAETSFQWTTYYMQFADQLLSYKERRRELLALIKGVYEELGIRYPLLEDGQPFEDICPFTVFGTFNKGITNENRIAILSGIGDKLGVRADVPTQFDGVPVLNNMKAWFFWGKLIRGDDDISNLWDMFEAALQYADQPSEITRNVFITCYDKVVRQNGVKWNLTMGLYWIRPFSYLNLDERNRSYLSQPSHPAYGELANISNFKQLPSATIYLELIVQCQEIFNSDDAPHRNFPELSYYAWMDTSTENTSESESTASFLKWFAPLINALRALGGSATPEQARAQIISDLNLSDNVVNETRGKTNVKKFDNEVAFARNYLVYDGYIDKSVRGVWTLTDKGLHSHMNEKIASNIFKKWVDIHKEKRQHEKEVVTPERDRHEVRTWIYSPGRGSKKWDEFHQQGIMGIGWDELGDLKQYPTKDAMKARMKELYGEEYTYMNAAHATWQFANELMAGDIVYAKKGRSKVIGRGIVESNYIYDSERDDYKHIHKVRWTHRGKWEHPGHAVMKTLTDITIYTEYVEKLEALFFDDEDSEEDLPETKEIIYKDYTEVDFLSEVFMDPESYETLVSLLKTKKNLILQGAPGVGKTFAARRLAYSIMGKEDRSRVMMVQFHQSYSYEDFIMGYRPTEEGFELTHGPFYRFCKEAQDDNEREYFFIIDEINRGNLSKIFGELLMLIEADKRSDKLRLLYSNEQFSVPKNIHIIGMMNTADRSLAMIDYALRRRFAFFELEPAFESDGFKLMMKEAANPKLNTLVAQVRVLNEAISRDESLGDGFRIGHSYFCTDIEATDEWLKSIVNYELIPLLNEYWFDEQAKVDEWTRRLRGVLND